MTYVVKLLPAVTKNIASLCEEWSRVILLLVRSIGILNLKSSFNSYFNVNFELLVSTNVLGVCSTLMHTWWLLTGIAISLKSLLKDDNEYVRCQSAQALTTLASKEYHCLWSQLHVLEHDQHIKQFIVTNFNPIIFKSTYDCSIRVFFKCQKL